MINFKEKKGITLVALVITIIVLLILAGVALSLVMGENGITERAVNAGKVQNMAGAKEKLELEVANLASEFYQAKYINGNVSESTIKDYVLPRLPGNIDGYSVTVSGDSVTLKSTTGSDRTTETATINSDGKVTWGGITTASANPCTVSFYTDSELGTLITLKTVDSGETMGASMPADPTKEPDETYTYTFKGWKKSTDNSSFTGSTVVSGNMSVFADWTAEVPPVTVSSLTTDEYGDYFDLGTSIFNLNSVTLEDSTHPLADWRIFSKDESGVWLILADYLPINGSEMNTFITGTGANQIGLVTKTGGDLTSYPYSVWSNTGGTDLITRLRNDWKGILPSSLQSNTNVTAVGALTVTQWQAGWNSNSAVNGSITIDGSEENGFNTQNIKSTTGYSNTLYFPHKSGLSNCWGYWFASRDFQRH